MKERGVWNNKSSEILRKKWNEKKKMKIRNEK